MHTEYGGGLWNTWFDRDLSVAGRVILSKCSSNKNNSRPSSAKKNVSTFDSVLVRIERPIMNIPNLAIHLNREVRNGFKFCVEENCVPILATEICDKFNSSGKQPSGIAHEHHSLLLELLAKELNVEVERIADFELYLYDTQPSRRGGAYNEFIYSARLDNLCSTFVLTKSLLDSLTSIKNETNIRMIASFDNEEIGSNSNRGAASNLLFTSSLLFYLLCGMLCVFC